MAPKVIYTNNKGKSIGKGRIKPKPDLHRNGSIQNTGTGLAISGPYSPPPQVISEPPKKKANRKKKNFSIEVKEGGQVTYTKKRQQRRKKKSQPTTKPAEKANGTLQLREGEAICLNKSSTALSQTTTMNSGSDHALPAMGPIDSAAAQAEQHAHSISTEVLIDTTSSPSGEAIPLNRGALSPAQAEEEWESDTEDVDEEMMDHIEEEVDQDALDPDFVLPSDEDEVEEDAEPGSGRPKLVPKSKKLGQSKSSSDGGGEREPSPKRSKLDTSLEVKSSLITTKIAAAGGDAPLKSSAAQAMAVSLAPVVEKRKRGHNEYDNRDNSNKGGRSGEDEAEAAIGENEVDDDDGGEGEANEDNNDEGRPSDYEQKWQQLIEILKNPPKRRNSHLDVKRLCATFPGSFNKERGNLVKGLFYHTTKEQYVAAGIAADAIRVLFSRMPNNPVYLADPQNNTVDGNPRKRAPKQPRTGKTGPGGKEKNAKGEKKGNGNRKGENEKKTKARNALAQQGKSSKVENTHTSKQKSIGQVGATSNADVVANSVQDSPSPLPSVTSKDTAGNGVARKRSLILSSAPSDRKLIEKNEPQMAGDGLAVSPASALTIDAVVGSGSKGVRSRRDSVMEEGDVMVQPPRHVVAQDMIVASMGGRTQGQPGSDSEGNGAMHSDYPYGDYDALECLDPTSQSVESASKRIHGVACYIADSLGVTRGRRDRQDAYALLDDAAARLFELSLRPHTGMAIHDARGRLHSQPPPSGLRRF